MTDSILAKTTRGAFWAIAWRMSRRMLGFANTLILARLLVPGDFGLVALATGFAQGIMALSTLGVEEALIRERAATRAIYDTAFTINMMRGLATAAIVALAAWPVSEFFGDPRLTPVMLALAVCGTITAFENIGIVEFRRDFAFQREFRLLLLPRLGAIAVTASAAVLWRSHWALVAGIATAQISTTILSYVMHPFRPRLALGEWRRLAGFSLWSWAIGVAIMLRDRADGFVIGRLLGMTEVGVYAVGTEFGVMPTYELAAPLSAACFSGFAAANRADEDIAGTYLRILAAMILVIVPAGAGISLVAGPAVTLAFGARWSEAAGIVEILGAAGASVVLGTVSFALLSARGILRPGFAINLLGMAIRGGGSLALVPWFGLTGAAWAYAASLLAENGAHMAVAFRRLGIRAGDLGRRIWRGLLATMAMVCVVRGAGLGQDMTAPLVSLLVAVPAGVAAYGAALASLWLCVGRPDGAERDLIALASRAVPGMRPVRVATDRTE